MASRSVGLDLDAGAFRAWLSAIPGHVYVGRTGSAVHCPLAKWLKARTGRRVEVRSCSYHLAGWPSFVPLPAWAVCFVAVLDHFLVDRDDLGVTCAPVRCADALAALEQAVKDA